MPHYSALFLQYAIKATIVLIAAGAVSLALRRSSAAARHRLWTAALFALLALPALSLLPSRVAVETAALPSAGVVFESIAPASPVAPAPKSTPWLLWAWTAGALAVSGRLLAGIARLVWLTRHAREAAYARPLCDAVSAQLGLRRAVRLLEVPSASMPLTWGFLRPMVLLPSEARDWPLDRLRLVLAHELAHIKRHDCLTQFVARLACALYWFHPLAWLAARQLRHERERASDDLVLSLGAKASEYAGHLVAVARGMHAPSAAWSAGVAMARPSDLEARVAALLDAGRRRGLPSRARAACAASAALLVILPLAVLRAPAQSGKATLAGVVYDDSRATVPGASILISNLDTRSKEIVTTRDSGDYSFVSIPAGRYKIEARKGGFELFQQTDVMLREGETARFDITLRLGSVNETVEVVGKAPARPAPVASAGAPSRIRVGGDVQATKLLYQVKPVYPESAQQRGAQGTVLLRAVIFVDGSLGSLGVINTLADPELARAATDAVARWRYQPTLLNGVPVEVVTTIAVNFRLD